MLFASLCVIIKLRFVLSEILATTKNGSVGRKQFISHSRDNIIQYAGMNVTDIWWPHWTGNTDVSETVTTQKLSTVEDFQITQGKVFKEMTTRKNISVFTDIRFLLNNRKVTERINITAVRRGETQKTDTTVEKFDFYDYLAGLGETKPGLEWMERTTPSMSPPTSYVPEPTTELTTQITETVTETTVATTKADPTTTLPTTPFIKEEEWTVSLPDNNTGPSMPTSTTTETTLETTPDPNDKDTPSTIKIGDALHGAIKITTTTKNQMAVELNKNIEKLHVGMYTIFVIKVLDLLSKLKLENLRELMFALEWYTERQHMNTKPSALDSQFTKLLTRLGRKVTIYEPDNMRSTIILAMKMLQDRREDMADDTNAILDILDEIFTEEDAPSMLTALETLQHYPQNNLTAYSVLNKIMHIILITPSAKMLGTPKHKIVFDAIIKAVTQRLPDGVLHQRRFGGNPNEVTKRGSRQHKSKGWKKNFVDDDRRSLKDNLIVDSDKNQGKTLKTKRFGKNKVRSNNNDVTKPKRHFTKSKRTAKIIEKYDKRIKEDIKEVSSSDISTEIKKNHGSKWKNAKKMLIKKMKQLARSDRSSKQMYKTQKQKNIRINNKYDLGYRLGNAKKAYDKQDSIKSYEINEQNKLYLKRKLGKKPSKDYAKFKSNKEKLLKKITQLSSVSDEEVILKRNILHAMLKQDGRKRLRKFKNYNKYSSYSDEEIKLKLNIYKAIGVNNDFNKVKT